MSLLAIGGAALGVANMLGLGGGKKAPKQSPHYQALSDVASNRIAEQQLIQNLQQLAMAQTDEERKRRMLQGGA